MAVTNLPDLLQEDVRSRTNKIERRFMDLRSKLGEQKQHASSHLAQEAFSIIGETTSNAENAGVDELKQRAERLKNLKKYIAAANLGKEEKALVQDAIDSAFNAIHKLYQKRADFLIKTATKLKQNSVNMGLLFLAAAGQDPLVALAAGSIDMLYRRRKRKQADKKERTERERKDQQSLSNSLNEPARPKSESGAPVAPKLSRILPNNTLGGDSLPILERIEASTSATERNTNELVRIALVSQELERTRQFDSLEASRETAKTRSNKLFGPGSKNKLARAGTVGILGLGAGLGITGLIAAFNTFEDQINALAESMGAATKILGRATKAIGKASSGVIRTAKTFAQSGKAILKAGVGLAEVVSKMTGSITASAVTAASKMAGSVAKTAGGALKTAPSLFSGAKNLFAQGPVSAVKDVVKGGAKRLGTGIPFLDFGIDAGFGAFGADNIGVSETSGALGAIIAGDQQGGMLNATFNALKGMKVGALAGGGIGGLFGGVGAIPGALIGGGTGLLGGGLLGLQGSKGLAQSFDSVLGDKTKEKRVTSQMTKTQDIMIQSAATRKLLRKIHADNPEQLKKSLENLRQNELKKIRAARGFNNFSSSGDVDIMFKGIANAETGGLGGGELGEERFIRTRIAQGDVSSAYGPVQITGGRGSIVKGHYDQGLFDDDPELKRYAERFMLQAQKFISHGNKPGGKYGPGGAGDLGKSPQDRKLYYRMASKLMQATLDTVGGNVQAALADWRFGNKASFSKLQRKDPDYVERFAAAFSGPPRSSLSVSPIRKNIGGNNIAPGRNSGSNNVVVVSNAPQTNIQNNYHRGGGGSSQAVTSTGTGQPPM